MGDAVRSIDWQNSAREYWAAREKRKYSTSGISQGKHCVLGHARPSNRQSCPCPCDCRKAPGREPCSTALAGWQRFQESIIHGDNSGNTGWQATSEVDKLGPAFPMPLCRVVILGELPGKYFRRCFASSHSSGHRICTCGSFAQRGSCPHIWYVAALHGEIDLRAVPTRGRPGRKRAATRTVLLPNGHADEMNRARQGKGLNLHRQRGLGKAIP